MFKNREKPHQIQCTLEDISSSLTSSQLPLSFDLLDKNVGFRGSSLEIDIPRRPRFCACLLTDIFSSKGRRCPFRLLNPYMPVGMWFKSKKDLQASILACTAKTGGERVNELLFLPFSLYVCRE